MTPGFFVAVEGPEGAGKSTLVEALAERMRRAGIGMVQVREPGGTAVAEATRQIFLDAASSLTPATELFLILAARADLVATVIRPALDRGQVVLADRYELSTLAYQVAGRGLEREVVTAANRLATGGLSPELTLIIDLPAAAGFARMRAAGKRPDRMERAGLEFHERVALAFAAAEGPGMRHLDGQRSPEDLSESAWDALRTSRPDAFRSQPH